MMKIWLLSVMLCCSAINCCAQTRYREEFNGTYASWANVKTRFKAAGDGIKDDTQALQTALDSLSRTLKTPFNMQSSTGYVVIYLPAGTYKISRTLRLDSRTGVSIIGEDPLKTIIKWAGGNADTMLFSNRSAYAKISRITWDTDNKKNMIAIGLHFKDYVEPFFAPTYMELSDMVFTGYPMFGLSCGTYASDGTGNMDSEFTIRRCKFYSAAGAAIRIKGFNALDYWIWDCEFNRCNIGVFCSNGNYHIYQSHFYNSVEADCRNKDILYSSIRSSYSENAAVFSLDEGSSCNALKRIFQDNIVKNCVNIPIQYHQLGKITLLDNYFYSQKKPVRPTVDYTGSCTGNYDILSIANSFDEERPFHVPENFPSKFYGQENKKLAAAKLKEPIPRSLQPFAPYVKRVVFEVPVHASGKAIQAIINKATALKGQRAVVHLPMGVFYIEQPLEIPTQSDIQIIGDGTSASAIRTRVNYGSDFFYFKIKGPSYITLKDFQLDQENGNNSTNNAFLFTGIDQAKSRVYLDQIHSITSTTLLIDKLDYTYFEKNNSFFSKGNMVIGGDKVKAGTGTSKLYCFGGQSAGAHLENNATMVAKDCWWEGNFRKDYIPLDLKGYGNLTVDGAMYAPADDDSGTVISVGDFKGKISLLNMYLVGSIKVLPGSEALNVLIWNINMYHKMDPFNFLKEKTNAHIAMMGITSQCSKSKDKGCLSENPASFPDENVHVPDLNLFLKQLTNDSRQALPQPYIDLAEGITNIYVSRISVNTGGTAFTFRQ